MTQRDGIAGRGLHLLARGFALVGGGVLVAMTLMSVGSIAGRALFGRPLQGDFELVQMGCTVCVSAFLPYCQLRGGNIIVDFFTSHAAIATQRRLDAFGAALLATVMAVVAWRTGAGALAVQASGETTMILGFPTWIGYAAMVPGFALTALVSLAAALRGWREAGAKSGSSAR